MGKELLAETDRLHPLFYLNLTWHLAPRFKMGHRGYAYASRNSHLWYR